MDAVGVSLLSSSQAVITSVLSLATACIARKFDKTFLLPMLGLIAITSELVIVGLAKTVWLQYIGSS